jgi:hypothetical protein
MELQYLEGFGFLLEDFVTVIFMHGELFEFP